jgi:hypothetical protein
MKLGIMTLGFTTLDKMTLVLLNNLMHNYTWNNDT